MNKADSSFLNANFFTMVGQLCNVHTLTQGREDTGKRGGGKILYLCIQIKKTDYVGFEL